VWGAIRETEDSCLAYTLHPRRATVKDLSDDELRSDLRMLERASEGAIVVRDLGEIANSPEPAIAAITGEHRESGELRARSYDRKIDRWWRIGSFSAMTSGASGSHGGVGAEAGAMTRGGGGEGAGASASGPEMEGRDRDEVDEPEPTGADEGALKAGGDAVVVGAGGGVPSSVSADAPAGSPSGEGSAAVNEEARVLLHDFPRGTKAGTLLHAILEEHDFTSADPEALPALVRDKLVAFGYEGRGLEGTLVRGIDAMLDTPLGIGVGTGARLRDIPRARRVDELEFLLPVTHGPRSQVTAKAIAEAFAKHRTDAVPAAYVDRLGQLGFVPLRGFLRGFVDLVFEHEGRFYVVDYKSNHLGRAASAYAPERLTLAMSHASYFLQYHLYTVAVHRWLARRMRGYDYDRAFGGVLYLFARGMHPAHPAGTGIFADRPKRALVEALSEVLDHG